MLCGYPPFVGRCGYDCGWVDGRSCIECQSLLMQAIREDQLVLPAEDWDAVSPEAKDLVTRVLERDISKRLTAAEVLQHDWLKTASLVASNPIPLLNYNSAPRIRFVISCKHAHLSRHVNMNAVAAIAVGQKTTYILYRMYGRCC